MSWVTLFWHCTRRAASRTDCTAGSSKAIRTPMMAIRSEEHTSELQSQSNLVCRLLLEKKKNTTNTDYTLDPQRADLFPITSNHSAYFSTVYTPFRLQFLLHTVCPQLVVHYTPTDYEL